MKLTWKNQNKNNNKKKKPSFAAKSNFPNLPFDQENQEEEEGSTKKPKKEENAQNQENPQTLAPDDHLDSSDSKQLAHAFHAQGNQLAEDGKYREALGKWEAALTLIPESAVLHEQKAQVLLEIGDAWNALKAAIRATELEPSWAEAWITLGRAQLNYGEPDSAIESFDKALVIKPSSEEARNDRQAASHLVKRRKQLHLSGLSTTKNRYLVGDKTESS